MLNLKYRYFIKMRYKSFLNLENIKAYNIIKKDETVCFYTSKEYIELLNNIEDIIIIDRAKSIKRLKKYVLFLIYLLLMLIIMLTSSLFIKRIEFKKTSIYNYDIEKLIENRLKTFWIFNYLEISLNDLNKELRSSYPHFAYIGVEKVGAKLVVDFVLEDNDQDQKGENNTSGDLIAVEDGYITEILSIKGVVVVSTSQSVKKGDLLISGNLNYKINPNDFSNLVHPNGIVLANVATYEKISVSKYNKEIKYSGKIIKGYSFSLFNKIIYDSINKENIGHIFYEDIFNVKNIITIKKMKLFEEEEVITFYDYSSAYNYASSVIIKDFNINKIHNDEKIISIDFINSFEYNDKYEFNFLVKKNKNICLFKKYDF